MPRIYGPMNYNQQFSARIYAVRKRTATLSGKIKASEDMLFTFLRDNDQLTPANKMLLGAFAEIEDKLAEFHEYLGEFNKNKESVLSPRKDSTEPEDAQKPHEGAKNGSPARGNVWRSFLPE
jgi:hypothetical protein